jgi:endonuclease/exonuclease/phosphatase family metal-dependent hydrolase
MIGAWVILGLVLSGLGFAAEPVRIVTWNLQWFPGGKMGGAPKEVQDEQMRKIREEVRKMDADILILQEVASLGALEELIEPLEGDWKVAILSRFKDGNFVSGQQVGIVSRFPAEAVWAESWNRSWAGAPRGYAYASFVIRGTRVAVYGVHLKSNLGNPVENTSKREDAMEQLLGHIKTGRERVPQPDAVVVAGDLNTDDPDTAAGQSPGERSFDFLRNAGFYWTFDGIPHGSRITCPGEGRYPDACFDHVFVRGLGKPTASVVNAEGSDHFPVVVDVVFGK